MISVEKAATRLYFLKSLEKSVLNHQHLLSIFTYLSSEQCWNVVQWFGTTVSPRPSASASTLSQLSVCADIFLIY